MKCVKCKHERGYIPEIWKPGEEPKRLCDDCLEIKDGKVFTSDSGGYTYYDPSQASKKFVPDAEGGREMTYCPDSGGYWF